MMPQDEAPKEPKKKRGPGRPKQDVHSASFTITMPRADFDQLNEQVATTGRSRSELLRMAWNGKPITLRYELAAAECYNQFVKLGTTLGNLEGSGYLEPVVRTQVQHILTQMDQKMVEISGYRNG